MAIEAQTRQRRKGLTFEDVWAALMETDRLIKELKESQKQTDKEIKALNKQMGGLHRGFGDLAEHLVAPGIAKKFNALGYHFEVVQAGGTKILDKKGKTLAEIDLLLQNGDVSVAVEIKSTPKEDDIPKHIARLEILRSYMDKHHDSRVTLGALASAVFVKSVKAAATEAGLYVLVQSGDTMQIESPKDFTPREW